ncbi:MAG TPA: MarC family NAAT transporter [Gammaproteobacteria bacterium]
MSWFAEGWAYVLSTVLALLPIVNPLSAIGVLLAITADLTERERNEQILRACVYMFFILVAFLIAGGLIMSFFGISIPGLRIAGGLLVAYLGFRMLFPEQATISGQERKEAVEKEDVSFTPLAMPSLSGPGSIAVVVGLSTTLQQRDDVVIGYVFIIVGIAITALISYSVLRASTKLHELMGATGINAVSRIMGFIMICIGVQFVINGVLEIVRAQARAA